MRDAAALESVLRFWMPLQPSKLVERFYGGVRKPRCYRRFLSTATSFEQLDTWMRLF